MIRFCSSGTDFNKHMQYDETGMVHRAATFTASRAQEEENVTVDFDDCVDGEGPQPAASVINTNGLMPAADID